MNVYLPWAPLKELAMRRWGPENVYREGSIDLALEMLGMNWTSYHRCEESGRITLRMADKIVTHLGMHPCEVWGEAYWQEDPCA